MITLMFSVISFYTLGCLLVLLGDIRFMHGLETRYIIREGCFYGGGVFSIKHCTFSLVFHWPNGNCVPPAIRQPSSGKVSLHPWEGGIRRGMRDLGRAGWLTAEIVLGEWGDGALGQVV